MWVKLNQLDRVKVGSLVLPPPCGISSLVLARRGLKMKIRCIDAATQMGETGAQDKFGSVCLCKSNVSGVEFACKTLNKGEETVH